MKHWKPLVLAALLAFVPAAVWAADEMGGVKPETTALYREAREQVEKLAATPAAKYAPETIAQAKESIAAAQIGLEAGNEKATRDGAERAALQAKLALAVTDEQIAAEKSAAAQKELAGLEKRLDTILAGKGEQP
jgi:hypothetical protein